MQTIRGHERTFERNEEKLSKIGISKPFDQYYFDWVHRRNCGDQIALIGQCAEWPSRGDRDFSHKDTSISDKTSDKYRVMTHSQLTTYANHLAQFLLAQFTAIGLPELAGNVIPIYLGRTNDTIAAMLGILRAGAAFTLLDEVELDDEGKVIAAEKFKDYFSRHSAPIRYFITTQQLWEPIKNLIYELNEESGTADRNIINIKPLFLENFFHEYHPNNYKDINTFKSRSSTEQLCYVAFSSGSTAAPKGINILHSGVVSRLLSHYIVFEENNYDMKELLKVPLLAPLRFDASIMQIMLGIGCGGTVLVVDENVRNNMSLLLTYLQNTEISAAILIPDQFRALNELCKDPQIDLPSLRIVLSTGEAFDASLLKRWLSDLIMLINAYGPTEMTVGLTLAVIKKLEQQRLGREKMEGIDGDIFVEHTLIGIGQPMLGTRLLIVKECDLLQVGQRLEVLATLDPDQSTVDNCDEGEIFALDIKPEYAARAQCYTNEPIMQERNFIYVAEEGGQYKVASRNEGFQAYRTGDRARIIDGELCVLGRYGVKQYKKNGRLLRLDSIEAVLKNYLTAGRYRIFTSVKVDYRPDTKHVIAYLNDFGIDPSQRERILAEIKGDHEVVYRDVRSHAQKYLDAYMLPSRWMLTTIESMGKAGSTSVKLPNDDSLQIIYRRSGVRRQSQIADLVKESWKEAFSDLNLNLINDDTQFDELGGDSFQYTLMLNYLQRRLAEINIISSIDFSRNLNQILRSKRKFSDFVATIESYQQQVRIIENNIKNGEGIQFGSEGTLFLFQSPFGVEQYANLKTDLCKTYFVYEVEINTEANEGSHTRQVECFAHAIVKKLDAKHKYQKHILLGGHSAGGNFAYWVAQKLAEMNNKYKVVVIMLDTPASVFAQQIEQDGYIAYITYCLCRSINTKKDQVIQVEFDRILRDNGCINAINNDNNTSLSKIKHKIIELAEKYLLSHMDQTLTATKIASMMNFCRLQLIPDIDRQCHKNVHVRLMTSAEYRDKVHNVDSDKDPIQKLLWSDSSIRSHRDVINSTENHEDFIRGDTSRFNVDKMSKVIEGGKVNSDFQTKINKTEEIVRRILMKTVSTLLASKDHQEIPCYIEPEYEGELLKDKIIRSLKSHRNENLSLLLKGDAGMGKTLFMLKLAQSLLMEQTNFVPIYVSMVNAYEKGFLQGKSYIKVVAELCCDQKDSDDDLSKQDVIDYLSFSNIIYLNDGCDEIPDEKLKDIYSQCIKDDKGRADGCIRHFLFTCRNEALNRHNESVIQNWFGRKGQTEVFYRYFDLMPLTYKQINTYLENFIESLFQRKLISEREATLRLYRYWLTELPGMDELIQNPLLLNLVVQVLPAVAKNIFEAQDKESISISRSIIYAHFFLKWIEREEGKFEARQKSPDEEVLTQPLRMGSYIAVYSINLAIHLWESHGYEFKIHAGALDDNITLQQHLLIPTIRTKSIFINIINSACTDFILRDKWLKQYDIMEQYYSGINLNLDYKSDEMLFNGRMKYNDQNLLHWEQNDVQNREGASRARIRLIRSHSLLKVCDNGYVNKYKFYHKSVIEYLTGMGILSSLSYFEHNLIKLSPSESPHVLINKKPMRDDQQLIKMIAEQFRLGEKNCAQFLENLFMIVLASRRYSGLKYAASNAISIIVKIDPLYLINKNISDVEIPYADLSNAFCCNTIFGHTDLSNVWCRNTDFSGAKIYHSIIPKLISSGNSQLLQNSIFFTDTDESLDAKNIKAVSYIRGRWLAILSNGTVCILNDDQSSIIKKYETGHHNFSLCQITDTGHIVFIKKSNSIHYLHCYKIQFSDQNSFSNISLTHRVSGHIPIDRIDIFSMDNMGSHIVICGDNKMKSVIQIYSSTDLSVKQYQVGALPPANKYALKFTRILFSPQSYFVAVLTNSNLIITSNLNTNQSDGNSHTINITQISKPTKNWLSHTQSIETINGDLYNIIKSNSKNDIGFIDHNDDSKHFIFKTGDTNGFEQIYDFGFATFMRDIFTSFPLASFESLCKLGKLFYSIDDVISLSDDGFICCIFRESKPYMNNWYHTGYLALIDITKENHQLQPKIFDSLDALRLMLDDKLIRIIYYDQINRHIISLSNEKYSNMVLKIYNNQLMCVRQDNLNDCYFLSHYGDISSFYNIIFPVDINGLYAIMLQCSSQRSTQLHSLQLNINNYTLHHNSSLFQRILMSEIEDEIYCAQLIGSLVTLTVLKKPIDNRCSMVARNKVTITIPGYIPDDEKKSVVRGDLIFILPISRQLILFYRKHESHVLMYMIIPIDCIDAKILIIDEINISSRNDKINKNTMLLSRIDDQLFELFYYNCGVKSIKLKYAEFHPSIKAIIEQAPNDGFCNNTYLHSQLIFKIAINYKTAMIDNIYSKLNLIIPKSQYALSSSQSIIYLSATSNFTPIAAYHYIAFDIDSLDIHHETSPNKIIVFNNNNVEPQLDFLPAESEYGIKNHIIELRVVNQLSGPKHILLYVRPGTLLDNTYLFYKGNSIALPALILNSLHWDLSISDVNTKGEFCVVLINRTNSPYYDDHRKFHCYIFNDEQKSPLRSFHSRFMNKPSLCLPSIKRNAIYTIQNDSELCVLSLNSNSSLTETVLFRAPIKINALLFSGDCQDKLAIMTSSGLYLFSCIEAPNGNSVKLLWFSGKNILNIDRLQLLSVYDMTMEQEYGLKKYNKHVSISKNNEPSSALKSLNTFFKQGDEHPDGGHINNEQNLIEHGSLFTFLAPQHRVTPMNWIMSVCVKKGWSFLFERPQFLVIEGIHQGLYFALEITNMHGVIDLKYIENTDGKENEIRTNYDVKQLCMSSESSIELISYLRSNLKLAMNDASMSGWIQYALSNFGNVESEEGFILTNLHDYGT